MDKMTVAHDITAFLKSVTADDSLTPSMNLIEAGVVDSLTMMDLVAFLEGRYEFRLAVDELSPVNFASAYSLADLVERKTSGDAARHAA